MVSPDQIRAQGGIRSGPKVGSDQGPRWAQIRSEPMVVS